MTSFSSSGIKLPRIFIGDTMIVFLDKRRDGILDRWEENSYYSEENSFYRESSNIPEGVFGRH